MVGSGLLTHAWAFSEAGILLSFILAVISFSVCYYTTQLMILAAKGDLDMTDTLFRLFGKRAKKFGAISAMLFMYGAVFIYFQFETQTLFPVIQKILSFVGIVSAEEANSMSLDVDFSKFSESWTCILQFLIIYPICNMKRLDFFIKMSQYGVICIFVQIGFVLGVGIYSISNTSYSLTFYQESTHPSEPVIAFWKPNFFPLAGILGAGFYQHAMALPILSQNKNKANNNRDMFLGFSASLVNYLVIGIVGYFGFSGSYFLQQGIPGLQ